MACWAGYTWHCSVHVARQYHHSRWALEAWDKALEAWVKALEAWVKALEAWDKALEAWVKALEAWVKARQRRHVSCYNILVIMTY